MNEENQISYYAVIPATVRYDTKLKAAEKLMYGEITSLTNRMGYCFANNKYFANLYNVSLSTISRWISNLAKLKYIEVELIRNEKKEITERRIYVLDNPYMQKNQYPYMQNCTYPISKKSKDNNINIKIDRLFNYIINNKSKFPEELKGTDLKEIYSVLGNFEMLYTDEIISFYTENNITKVKYIIYALVEISKTDRKTKLNKLSRDKLIGIYNKCKQKEDEIINFYDYFVTSIINELDKP